MIRHLLFLFLFLILAGCASFPEDRDLGLRRSPIEFQPYIGRPLKAVEKSSFNEGDAFSVYAHRSAVLNESITAAFDGRYFADNGSSPSAVVVTKQSGGDLKTDRKVFWPDAGYLDFVAVMQNTPSDARLLTFGPAALAFTQVADVTAQHDLLVAVSVGKQRSLNSVMLQFKHILSKLQFEAQGDDVDNNYMVKVQSITVKNVSLTGNYLFTGHRESGIPSGSWSLDDRNTPIDCSAGMLASAEVKNDKPYSVTSPQGAMLLIPQKATSLLVAYELHYKIGPDSSPTYKLLSSQSSTVDLSSDTWQPGRLYTYLLKIKPEAEIQFSLTLGGWSQDDSPDETPESLYPSQPEN